MVSTLQGLTLDVYGSRTKLKSKVVQSGSSFCEIDNLFFSVYLLFLSINVQSY